MSDPVALDRLAAIHSLLGSPTRLAFVNALASGPKSGTALGELTGVSLSAVSQHMSKMKEGGLVGWSRDPNRRQVILFYLIEPHHPLVATTVALLSGKG